MDMAQAVELTEREVFSILAEERAGLSTIYTSLAEIVPISPDGGILGDKMTEITSMGDLEETGDHESYPEDSFETAWTRYFRIPKFARRLTISERDIAATDAAQRIPNLVANRIESYRRSWALRKETIVAALFNDGALTAGSTVFDGTVKKLGFTDPNPKKIYDGDTFFSTTHPLATNASADISNFAASAALSAATLQTALTAFKKTMAVDERNRRYMNVPRKLAVAQELEWTARTILESALIPGSGNNDANVVMGSLELVTNPFFETSTAWAVLGADDQAPIRAYDSGELRARVWFNSDKKQIVVDVDGFFGANVKLWNGCYGANWPTT